MLLLGVNGNVLNDRPYDDLLKVLSYKPHTLQYKNIFGENFSASALGFHVGAKILEKQMIPAFLSWHNEKESTGNLEYMTILNQSDNTTWSLIRLKKV